MAKNNDIPHLLEVRNSYTGKAVPGYLAKSLEDLSLNMPVTRNGKDYALMHSAIKNPDDWYVIIKYYDPATDSWIEIFDDPRVYKEDILEELYPEYIL